MLNSEEVSEPVRRPILHQEQGPHSLLYKYKRWLIKIDQECSHKEESDHLAIKSEQVPNLPMREWILFLSF